ncbi:MAG: hypothetical protein AAGJ28_05380 [Pseudomonadota bacterium]
MTATHPYADTPDWTEPVIAFLREAIPVREPGRWDHLFGSAFQMGVMAQAGLGQVRETTRGAIALPDPKLPERLPRWDDLCCAVLGLFLQQGAIEYRNRDGTRYEPPRRRGEIFFRHRDAPLPPMHLCPPIRTLRLPGDAALPSQHQRRFVCWTLLV